MHDPSQPAEGATEIPLSSLLATVEHLKKKHVSGNPRVFGEFFSHRAVLLWVIANSNRE